MSYYILDDKKNAVLVGFSRWSTWFSDNDDKRKVGLTTLEDGMVVSTVFVGIDISEEGYLFETLISSKEECTPDGIIMRYKTWAVAEEGHNEIVENTKRRIEPKKTKLKKIIKIV